MATETAALEELQNRPEDLILRAKDDKHRIAISEDGKVVVALVSAKDLERLEALERRNMNRREFVESIRAKFADTSEEELIREAEKAVREVREEMDQERRARMAAEQSSRDGK